jgi:hypothetical protein
MKTRTFLWIGLAVLSAAAFLVSWSQGVYAEETETHGGAGFFHEDRKDVDRLNSRTGESRDHGEVDRDTTSVGMDRGEKDRRHDDSGWDRRDADRNRDSARRSRHDYGRDLRPGDGRWVVKDGRWRHERWGDRNGTVLIFTWGPTDRYDKLGTVWYETEGAYRAVWTRRGESNVFDGVWTYGDRTVTAVLTIDIDGDHVNIHRRYGSDGYDYDYTGILSGDETRVQGRVTGGGVVRADWEATITGYRR